MFFEHIQLGKLGRGRVLAHDAIGDFVVGEGNCGWAGQRSLCRHSSG